MDFYWSESDGGKLGEAAQATGTVFLVVCYLSKNPIQTLFAEVFLVENKHL